MRSFSSEVHRAQVPFAKLLQFESSLRRRTASTRGCYTAPQRHLLRRLDPSAVSRDHPSSQELASPLPSAPFPLESAAHRAPNGAGLESGYAPGATE